MRKNHLTILGLGALATLILGWGSPLAALAAEAGETGYSSEQWNDFIWRVINFAIFFGVLFFLLKKPIKNFFAGRKENISRTLEYLETQAKNLEEQNGALQKELSQLAGEKDAILAQYERDGARERDRIVAEAQKTADSIIRKAEVAMDQELKTVRRSLARDAGLLAAQIAGDLLAQNVNDEDRGRLSLEFVEEITKLPARR
ncbi:MAG: ATP synthase F0 subunit B [Deltaproteobacteria bacterium]|jgi:F-type H+-transporting ATPase subunit b|nr:ATP synthase F0 subunit B [Deltaproteobacteria bacterium]